MKDRTLHLLTLATAPVAIPGLLIATCCASLILMFTADPQSALKDP